MATDKSASKSSDKETARAGKKARKPVTIDLEPAGSKAKPGDKAGNPGGTEKTEAGKAAAKHGKDGPAAADAKPAGDRTGTPAAEKSPEKTKPDTKTAGAAASAAGQPEPGQPSPERTGSKPVAKPARGTADLVTAALAGGVVALAGAWLLHLAGVFAPAGPDISNLVGRDELANVESRVGDLAGKVDGLTMPDTGALVGQLEQLQAMQNEQAGKMQNIDAIQSETSGKLTSLFDSLAGLLEETTQLKQSISSGGAGEQAGLAALSDRLAALEAAGAEMAETRTAIEGLGARVNDLAAQLTAGGGPEQTRSKLEALANNLGVLNQQFLQTNQQLKEQVSQLSASTGQADSRLTELSGRLDGLAQQVAAPGEQENRVARVLALAGLKSAVDSGRAFPDALALYRDLTGDSQSADLLQPFADSGIGDLAALRTSFNDVSEALLKAAAPEPEGGLLSRYAANARGLIKLPASQGDAQGESVEAIIARIATALKGADLAAVEAEWQNLPEAVRIAGADWIAMVAARRKADTLMDDLLRQFAATASDGATSN